MSRRNWNQTKLPTSISKSSRSVTWGNHGHLSWKRAGPPKESSRLSFPHAYTLRLWVVRTCLSYNLRFYWIQYINWKKWQNFSFMAVRFFINVYLDVIVSTSSNISILETSNRRRKLSFIWFRTNFLNINHVARKKKKKIHTKKR